MEDGARFRIFRHVTIRTSSSDEPQAVFIVRFRPAHVTVQANIRFSLLTMMIFMGFRGFREKFWCVNDETGLCQGVYAWQTLQDAQNYASSVAMRVMTNRSEPDSVTLKVLEQERRKYWLFQPAQIQESATP